MTERLYFHNPYLKEFSANVVDVVNVQGKTGLILDRTAFYPTGGGQPHDTGYINEYRVVEVIEDGERIIHVIEGEYAQEQSVIGRIDWTRRYDHMQQHAGQHLLSAVIRKEYGYETVGFHLGNETVTIDINTDQHLPYEEIERKVFELILRKLPIESQFVARDELDPYVIRKVPDDQPYIRIVEIPDIDYNACCGTHPSFTSEIGLVKILRTEIMRGNRRMYFVAGWRAFMHFQNVYEQMTSTVQELKTNPMELIDRIRAIKENNDHLQKELRKVNQERIVLEAQVRRNEYEDLGGFRLYCKLWNERPVQEIKDLAKTLIESGDTIVLYGIESPTSQLVLACSDNVPLSMQEIVSEISRQVGAKGGGNRVFAQVVGMGEMMPLALQLIKQHLRKLHDSTVLGNSRSEKEV